MGTLRRGASHHTEKDSKPHTERGQVVRLLALVAAMMVALAGCGSADTGGAVEADEDPTDESDPGENSAEEESVVSESCVDGNRITLVHGHSPAGGYDAYTRFIAPYLADELGVNVVVEVEEGAAGLVAMNTTFNATPDGTRIQVLNGPGTANAFLAEDPATSGLDMAAAVYLAQLSGEPMAVFVASDSEFETFEDMLASDRPVRFGSSGPGSADWGPPRIFEHSLDMNLDMITGFDTAEIVTAILRGEVDGLVSTIDSRRAEAENGDFRPLVLQATEPTDAEWFIDLFGEDVPTQMDFADQTDDEGTALLETNALVTELGRVLITTPGTPDDVVTCLRDAIERVFTDEAFLETAIDRGLPVTFRAGVEYQETVVQILEGAPESYGQLLGSDD